MKFSRAALVVVDVQKAIDAAYHAAGVGSDGLLYGPIVEPDGFRVVIFNPDGSEAEKSGNGIRIFARYLHDVGHVRVQMPGGEIEVDFDGARHVRMTGDVRSIIQGTVSTDLALALRS